jgi:hypothetical protein
VRGAELDWLRRPALEILGQQVSELQTRKRVDVDRPVAAVDTGSADTFLEPASVVFTENVALPTDQELNLHALKTVGDGEQARQPLRRHRGRTWRTPRCTGMRADPPATAPDLTCSVSIARERVDYKGPSCCLNA